MTANRLKQRAQKGFSLAETLVALIIILLVSSIVAAGMPAAQKAFYNVRESANAQVLLSTTLTELRNEIETASDIRLEDGKLIYVNPVTGNSVLEYRSDKKNFWISAYQDVDANGSVLDKETGRQLVSSPARTDTLMLVSDNTSPFDDYKEGDPYITVKGFSVQSKLTGDAELASIEDFKINILVR